MRTSSLAVTILAVATVFLTVLVLVPVSGQAATVRFEGNTATGVDGVVCGDGGVTYDVTFVFERGVVLYGDPPDFPFKGANGDASSPAEEQTYGCSRIIQEELNAASEAITRVGPQKSSYFLIGAAEEEGETGGQGEPSVYGVFESRYYDDASQVDRAEDTWVPADNFNICIFDCVGDSFNARPFGSNVVDPDVAYSYAKLEFADGSPPAATESVGGQVSAAGGVTGLTGSGLVLQNNGGNDLAISTNGDFVFTTLLAPNTTYSVTVKTQPSGQFCSVARGTGSVPAGGVEDVLVTCSDPPATDDLAYVSKTAGCNGNTPCFTSINDAIAAQLTGTLIRITAEDYDEAVVLSSDKSLTLSGGWNAAYSNKNSVTTTNTLTVENGSLVTDAIVMDGPPAPPENNQNAIEEWCTRDACETNTAKFNECVTSLTDCLAAADTDVDREQCAGAAFLICLE